MSKVLLEMIVSLDGYVTGPDVTAEEPMGRGGEQLHDWMFEGKTDSGAQAFETDRHRGIGALVIGRRMADLGIGPWAKSRRSMPRSSSSLIVRPRPSSSGAARRTSSSLAASGMPFARPGRLRGTWTSRSTVARTSRASTSRPALWTSYACTLCPWSSVVARACSTQPSPPDVTLLPTGAFTSRQVAHLTYVVEPATAATS